MNAQCTWPPEGVTRLNLVDASDARHLVLDTEVLEELVDRHRFHPVAERQRCEPRLIAEIARIHSVTAMLINPYIEYLQLATNYAITVTDLTVPEPATLGLVLAGLSVAGVRARRRRV